jgi:hypothetical protein
VEKVLLLLACPVGMGACMWLMGKGMRRDKKEDAVGEKRTVLELRREHARLGEEIERFDGDPPRAGVS